VLKLTHYSAFSGAGCVDLQVDVSQREYWVLHQRFESLCQAKAVRTINWAQTFAMRGYRYEDYCLERIEKLANGERVYYFLRREAAAQAWPLEMIFMSQAFPKGSAGEVLTYGQWVPTLSATKRFEAQLPLRLLPPSFPVDDALYTRFFFSTDRINEIFGTPLTLLDAGVEKELTRDWIPASSFLVVARPC
jgi:hypothetical protein